MTIVTSVSSGSLFEPEGFLVVPESSPTFSVQDTNLCVDTDHVREFAIIINNALKKLDKMSFSGHSSATCAIFRTRLRGSAHVVLG